MKLKSFHSENCASRRGSFTGKPGGSCAKTGNFSFGKMAAEKIGLIHGDTISFHQDDKAPEDWYISIDQPKTSPKGFTARKGKNGVFTITNGGLGDLINASLGQDNRTSFKYLIGESSVGPGDVEIWPLLIKLPR